MTDSGVGMGPSHNMARPKVVVKRDDLQIWGHTFALTNYIHSLSLRMSFVTGRKGYSENETIISFDIMILSRNELFYFIYLYIGAL